MRISLKLKQKLVLFFVGFAIIPAFIATFITINNSKNLVEGKVENLTKQISVEKISFIDTFMGNISNDIDSITKKKSILDWNINSMRDIIMSLQEADPNILYVYTANDDKNIIIYPNVQFPSGYDPTSRPWYKDAVNDFGKIIITKPYEDAASKQMVITIAKAYKLSDGKTAVAAADINIDILLKSVTNTKVGETGYAALSLDDGTIIAHPKKEMVMVNIAEKYDFGKEIVSKKSGNLKYNLNGEDKIMGFEQSKLTNWIVMTTMNQSEYAKELNKSIVQTLIIIGIITILAVFIGFMISRQIANPLINLSKLMEKAQNGDFTIEVKKTSNDEVGQIQDSFRMMIEAQKEMIKKVVENANSVTVQSESLSAISEEMASSSQELAKTMQQVAEGSSSQASDLQDIVGLMSNLTDSIENVYKE
ncbi:PDC sensor domain-containing protein, partial [Caloramator mitchellensis]|uniref:PDC sensor domain-containing protein n=1 Tax=Caloramator mitchellensis TaxID=908809 RepID=UPI00128EACF5